MTIAVRKITAFAKTIAALADLPALGSTSALKAWWDSSPEELRVALDGLIDDLLSTTLGTSGAENIGSPAIAGLAGGLASNTYAQIADLKSQLTGMVLGQIPDGTLTLSKMATDVLNRLNQVYSTERQVANLTAVSTIANRVDGASSFIYDLNDGLNGGSAGKIDNTKTNSTGTIAVSAGTIAVPVSSTTGFAVGQEVTIFDDVNLERRIITAISAGVSLSFAAMTNSYKIKAQICRSSVIQDTVNKLLKFGGWSYLTTYTNTAVSVVASAYDTSGNGGRKLVGPLTNGWLVNVVINGTTNAIFYKSSDNGATWSQLCTLGIGSITNIAICSSGNVVYCLVTKTTNSLPYAVSFNASTQTNIDIVGTAVTFGGAQTAFGAGSIAISATGTLTAAFCSKNATYPNSFNIQSVKSVDGGATWTKQDGTAGVDQITTLNSSGQDNTNPCVIVNSSNKPAITYQQYNGSAYLIWINYFTTVWSSQVSIFSVATYSNLNTCSIIKQFGSNIGRIWSIWDQLDATDTTKRNLRANWSDDGGATWNTSFKVTSGNTIDRQKPSLSENTNGDIYVSYMDGTGISYQVCANGGTTFSGTTTLNATGTNPSSIEHLGLAFTVPPTVYMSGTSVLFTGTFQASTTTPVLVEDVRYNINPPANVSSTVAWVDHDADANYSIAGAVSFQAGGGNESFASMTKTTAAIDGTHNEDQFTGSGTAAAKATLRLTLTRNSTALVKNISSVMGAVGA